MPGNQHRSEKKRLTDYLCLARELLHWGQVRLARGVLTRYRNAYALAPASTRRRWKCGR